MRTGPASTLPHAYKYKVRSGRARPKQCSDALEGLLTGSCGSQREIGHRPLDAFNGKGRIFSLCAILPIDLLPFVHAARISCADLSLAHLFYPFVHRQDAVHPSRPPRAATGCPAVHKEKPAFTAVLTQLMTRWILFYTRSPREIGPMSSVAAMRAKAAEVCF